MSNVVKIYHDLSDVGNHENHIKKIGIFTNMVSSYRVTFVSRGGATVESSDGVIPLETGMLLGANALVLTNHSNVEITDSMDNRFRLKAGSQFCIESTIQGVRPVLYGNISVLPSSHVSPILDQKKYYTSCWCQLVPQVIECISSTTDCYYALDSGLEITEFDEDGARFVIVKLNPYEKCILQADFSKDMRERYTVLNVENLSTKDINRIYSEYISPICWNKRFIENEEHIEKLG